jgi:hypothetical protein
MAIDINIPSQVKNYANLAAFPATGSLKTIFIAEDTNKTYRWTGSAYVEISASQATAWGTITGTLSSQTDLNTALSGKVPTTRTLTINGTTQDLSADRTFTISTGITIGTTAITSGTVGRVLFEGTGNVVQESANLFWDNTNGRLGIGTATPTSALHVSTSASTTAVFQQSGRPNITFLNNTTSIGVVGGAVAVSGGASNDFGIGTNGTTNNLIFATGAAYSERFRVFGTTGNVAINTTTDAGFKLDVNGTARVVNNLLSGNGTYFTTGSQSIASASTAGAFMEISSGASNSASLVFSKAGSLSTLWQFYCDSSNNLAFFRNGANKETFKLFESTKNVGIDEVSASSTFTDVASAKLFVNSTTKGFLPPRMTTTQKNAIATPATGLMVYDTTLNLISVYNGTIWISL